MNSWEPLNHPRPENPTRCWLSEEAKKQTMSKKITLRHQEPCELWCSTTGNPSHRGLRKNDCQEAEGEKTSKLGAAHVHHTHTRTHRHIYAAYVRREGRENHHSSSQQHHHHHLLADFREVFLPRLGSSLYQCRWESIFTSGVKMLLFLLLYCCILSVVVFFLDVFFFAPELIISCTRCHFFVCCNCWHIYDEVCFYLMFAK